jgi:hypothetical protein
MRSAHVRFVIICVILAGIEAAAYAQAAPGEETPGPARVLIETVKDLAGLASLDSARTLVIGGAGALAIHTADSHINQQVSGSDYQFLGTGEFLGLASVQAGAAFGTDVVGRAVSPRSRTAAIGQQLVRAQFVTQTTTLALKVTVRRERPDGSDHYSFPSGHASTTFATATILGGNFGWRVAVPAYLVATGVATQRLRQNRHFASDVVFGAALGVAAGRVTLRRDKGRVFAQPVIMAGGGGMVFTW